MLLSLLSHNFLNLNDLGIVKDNRDRDRDRDRPSGGGTSAGDAGFTTSKGFSDAFNTGGLASKKPKKKKVMKRGGLASKK